ncbi:hypothetical protein [Kocuria sp. CPCC 205263]|uniref:hypothetical protein n=1 Tax=Kocuria sp. CPCC 205263 TaxID=3073555 RepID=UPI0034D4914E
MMNIMRKTLAGATIATALVGGSLATPALASSGVQSETKVSSTLSQTSGVCYYNYWVAGYWTYDNYGYAYWVPGYWATYYYYC